MDPTMEIWVDDAKRAPEGMAWAKNYDDAVAMMRRYPYAKLWLDHDLGDDGRTGLHLLRQLRAEGVCPKEVQCISWNPVGRAAINAELERPA